jgi:hypothetical protein
VEGALQAFSRQKGDESESELRVRKNIQRSLAFKLNALSSEFRGSQKEYLRKLQVGGWVHVYCWLATCPADMAGHCGGSTCPY